MSAKTKDYAGLLKDIRAAEVNKVQVATTDIDGILRGKFIHKDKFLNAADSGFGFCNVVFGRDSNDVAYDNSLYTGWHTGYPNANVILDLATCRRLPWDQGAPFFLGDFETPEGSPLAVCPRQLLKKVVDTVYKTGFTTLVGCEFEWFNFNETPHSLEEKGFHALQPLTPGMFGYSLLRAGQNGEYFTAIMDEMAEFDVPLDDLHTETGPGIYEAAIMAADALEAADRAVLFKSGIKRIANRYGILASFMARWSNQYPSCSGHIHQSLIGADGNRVFYDEKDPLRISRIFKSYIAGILHCLPDTLVMYAPTVNSYKRLVPGSWAPTQASWGIDNRTCALRVIPAGPASTRLEMRAGGADLNPYLAIAATLAAGVYGIQHNLSLEMAPVTGRSNDRTDLVKLPSTLQEATKRFRRSDITRELFGDEFVDHFANTREWEWQRSLEVVTDWELRRYFEII